MEEEEGVNTRTREFENDAVLEERIKFEGKGGVCRRSEGRNRVGKENGKRGCRE